MSRRSLLIPLGLVGAGGAFAIALGLSLTSEPPAPQAVDGPERFVELLVEEPAVDPAAHSDAGNGARREEGQVGRKGGAAKEGGDASGDKDQATGIGGLVGGQDVQVGSGGLGGRGSGLGGGGGVAQGLGGLGSRGFGASGYGSGHGSGSISIESRPDPALDRTARPRLSVDGTEQFTDHGVGAPVLAAQDNLSTFAVDVDTGSYTLARSSLTAGSLPAASSVRVEEFVNYFDYDYVGPTTDAPFAVNMEAAPSPWLPGHHVLRVGVQGDRLDASERKPARLVFLVDVSGSMSGSGRLDLAKQSLSWLVGQLGPEDSVGLVTYAGSVARVLEPTPVTDEARILAAIDGLRSGGSTAMGSGIDIAYQMAAQGFVPGAENRVIVLSDGDANVGSTSHEQILEGIRGHAREGITLSTVGFGRGNYKDTMMEQLADEGDGNYSYVDNAQEGRRVFGQRLSGTVQTIARDVKIQVEFNPEAVLAWRLIGYENRDIADEDFRDDAVDAGEIGSGHSVTALYDVVLRDDWRSRELATVRLRAKPPGADAAAEEWLTTFPPRLLRDELDDASADLRLALGAATFAELLRGSPHVEEVTYAQVWSLVRGARRPGEAEDAELLSLIERAGRLTGESMTVASR